METMLSRSEFNVFVDVLERIHAKQLLDYDGCIFKFSCLSANVFLNELPAVVSILSQNKSKMRYDDFIRSLGVVVEIITEIRSWEFCLRSIEDLIQSLYDSNLSLKGGEQ